MESDDMRGAFPAEAYEDIDLMLFPARSLFAHYDFARIGADAAASYLLGYSRILQIEHLMWKANCLTEEYRSLRSVPNRKLRDVLQAQEKDPPIAAGPFLSSGFCGDGNACRTPAEAPARRVH